MTKFDVHNYNRRFELVISGIKKSGLPNTTKKLLLEFSDYCIAEGLAPPTIVKHLFCLKNVAKWANKNLDKTNKKDMVRIVGALEKSHYSCEVKHAIKVSIKKFYKWLDGGEYYPEKVRWIKSSQKIRKRLPKELLSLEEVEKLIAAADHIRDKALVSALYESGFRIGELLSLTLNNIEFDEYGAKIVGDGKTGMRRIRLVASAPFLATWIENHPLRDNPESPLWLGIGTKNKNEAICYGHARQLIHKLAKKAGIKKRVHPHLFRHSAATNMANHFTEAQLNHFFGWVQGSRMPATYIHMSGRDIDGAVLEFHGLKPGSKVPQEKLSPKKCPRCEKMNPPTGRFCTRCGAPLNLETAMKVEEKIEESGDLITILLKDPKVHRFINDRLNHLKSESQTKEV
jgi:site-specific recombinase XerD